MRCSRRLACRSLTRARAEERRGQRQRIEGLFEVVVRARAHGREDVLALVEGGQEDEIWIRLGSSSRTRRHSSRPSIRGISQSLMTTSGRNVLEDLERLEPSSAAWQVWPQSFDGPLKAPRSTHCRRRRGRATCAPESAPAWLRPPASSRWSARRDTTVLEPGAVVEATGRVASPPSWKRLTRPSSWSAISASAPADEATSRACADISGWWRRLPPRRPSSPPPRRRSTPPSSRGDLR